MPRFHPSFPYPLGVEFASPGPQMLSPRPAPPSLPFPGHVPGFGGRRWWSGDEQSTSLGPEASIASGRGNTLQSAPSSSILLPGHIAWLGCGGAQGEAAGLRALSLLGFS